MRVGSLSRIGWKTEKQGTVKHYMDKPIWLNRVGFFYCILVCKFDILKFYGTLK